jgi:hypothetical protein
MNGRTLIGRSSSLVSREAIWQLPDGVEIQSKENYEVVRRRVLYEDIVFVTYHRQYGAGYLSATGMIALFFLSIAFAILGGAGFNTWPATIPLFVVGLPALIAFSLRLMFRLDVITVFGKRTKASIRFRLRKKRAREVYAQIVAAVQTAQERMAREIAAEEDEAQVADDGEQPPMPEGLVPDRIED